MSRQLRLGQRHPLALDAIDATKYVFLCPLCPWQVQAGYTARRDLGVKGIFEAVVFAFADHVDADHADDDSKAVFADGTEYDIAGRPQGDEGNRRGALAMTPLPRWWVDR